MKNNARKAVSKALSQKAEEGIDELIYLSKSKVDLCGICSLRVKANSVLCVHCSRLILGRCF